MGWYVEVTYTDNSMEFLYFSTRAEARARRRFYLSWADVKQATVRHY